MCGESWCERACQKARAATIEPPSAVFARVQCAFGGIQVRFRNSNTQPLHPLSTDTGTVAGTATGVTAENAGGRR